MAERGVVTSGSFLFDIQSTLVTLIRVTYRMPENSSY